MSSFVANYLLQQLILRCRFDILQVDCETCKEVEFVALPARGAPPVRGHPCIARIKIYKRCYTYGHFLVRKALKGLRWRCRD